MIQDNIINHSNGTVIINGGNPLEGCPKSWDEAWKLQADFNGIDNTLSQEEIHEITKEMTSEKPTWSFDCGFKLDYDGDVLKVGSRFYPPTTHGGSTWDGTVTIYFLGNEVEEKAFDCATIQELKIQVEKYVGEIISRVQSLFTKNSQ